MEAITDPGLLLKVTPPKLLKSLLVRERLRRLGAADDDATVILVEAPTSSLVIFIFELNHPLLVI